VRGHEVAARIGGEEFIVLLTDTDGESSISATERTRRDIRESTDSRITTSAGIALWPEHAKDLTRLLRVADGALYKAKRSGRDRTCIPVTPTEAPASPDDQIGQRTDRERTDAVLSTSTPTTPAS